MFLLLSSFRFSSFDFLLPIRRFLVGVISSPSAVLSALRTGAFLLGEEQLRSFSALHALKIDPLHKNIHANEAISRLPGTENSYQYLY